MTRTTKIVAENSIRNKAEATLAGYLTTLVECILFDKETVETIRFSLEGTGRTDDLKEGVWKCLNNVAIRSPFTCNHEMMADF